jgi:hypothetical protein
MAHDGDQAIVRPERWQIGPGVVAEGLEGGGGGDGPYIPSMNERLGKLEGQMEGVKHGHNMLLGGLGLIGGFIVLLVTLGLGIGIYELQRIDQLSDKVNELPGKISSDLRDITKTLAESINAAKQQPPQIILIPPPQQQPSTQK